jgi:hypothetical protein
MTNETNQSDPVVAAFLAREQQRNEQIQMAAAQAAHIQREEKERDRFVAENAPISHQRIVDQLREWSKALNAQLAASSPRFSLNEQSKYEPVLAYGENHCGIQFKFFGPPNAGTDPGIALNFWRVASRNEKTLNLRPVIANDELIWYGREGRDSQRSFGNHHEIATMILQHLQGP